MAVSSTLTVIFKGEDSTLGRTADRVGASFGKLGGIVAGAAAVGVTALAGLAVGAVGLGAKLVGMGSDAEEMLGKFDVVFANTGGRVTDQLTAFANEVGRSRFELQGMASTFGDTLKPMGFTEDAAADLAVMLSELAVDLGSFNDMETDEALRRLQGTLIGSHENALAFGVIINENTLKAELAAQGWDELTGAAFEQAKVQARINLLLAGTTDAQGDAARTSQSWANQMRGLKARLTDTATEIGLKLLPAVTPLLGMIGELAQRAIPLLTDMFENKLLPIIQDVSGFFRGLVANIQDGLDPIVAITDAFLNWTNVGENLSDEAFDFVVNLDENIKNLWATVVEFTQPLTDVISGFFEWKDVLIALAIVLAGVVLSAIISIVVAIGPILLALAAIVAAVALVRQIWENDFLGIRTALVTFWTNHAQPILRKLQEWLGENIPIAIEFLTDLWTNTLLPAIETVWSFIKGDLFPLFEALWELIEVAGGVALTAIQGIWQNVLEPALQSMWEWISDRLLPVWESFEFMMGKVSTSLGGVSGAISTVIGWIRDLIGQLSNISLPDWMTPGSATPWELGLIGVRAQLQGLSTHDIPALSMSLNGLQRTTNNSTSINQTNNIYTSSVDVGGLNRAQTRFLEGGI